MPTNTGAASLRNSLAVRIAQFHARHLADHLLQRSSGVPGIAVGVVGHNDHRAGLVPIRQDEASWAGAAAAAPTAAR